MTLDPHVENLKQQIALKKERYAKLRAEARRDNGAGQQEFQEMLVLLQEINYIELCFRRDPGVADFLKEPDPNSHVLRTKPV